uniref:(California timema) hypothetical protein n=1 Tax=Timema californicum TaxID=61474 RepID=A0A7R9J2E2_TIMCA|nr:unnamed protein product [Timema californicum]
MERLRFESRSGELGWVFLNSVPLALHAIAELGLLENPQQSLKYLMEIEELGEEILVDRNEVVALDRRRNQTREALRALMKEESHHKTWMTVGSMLVKLPVDKAKDLLQRDQVQLDCEINKLRSELKVKVNKLRDMEFQPPVPGLMLNAMSKDEMKAVYQILSGKSS